MSRFKGKTALVTGGTTGIGLATARRLHAEGARVFVTGRNPETLAAARATLPQEVAVIQADSGSLEAMDDLMARIGREAGRLDVLFVNAGIVHFAPVEAADEAHWDQTLGVNLKGPFFLAQKALPWLGKGASVVFTSSIVGRKGLPTTAAYSASKAGLAALARVLAAEWAPKGIRVNSVSPGPIQTPILGKLGIPAEAMDGFEASLRQRTLLQRLGADEEVAKAVCFLASDESSYITGEELMVDGGLVVA